MMFVETYRTTVAVSDCDHLGHMNVQHYFAAVSEGMFSLMDRLGLNPQEIHRRRRSFAVVRAETDFQRELRAEDVISLESTVLKVGENSVTFQHRLKNVRTGEMAMTTVFKCVLLDLESRQGATIPEDIRAATSQLLDSTFGSPEA
jgi:acyl-CoA thioesterase FadM